MKILLQLILMYGGTFGFIAALVTLAFEGPYLIEYKKRPLLWIFSLMGLIIASILCIFISFNCFNSVTEEKWNRTINIATETVEIHQNDKKIEITQKTDGVLKTESISYEGEIEDTRNSQKDNHSDKVKITAKEIKQESLLSSNREYLTNVKIEYANE